MSAPQRSRNARRSSRRGARGARSACDTRASCRLERLELPGEAARGPAGLLALVEAMSVSASLGAVQLEMGGASLARPPPGGVQEGLSDSLRAVPGADRQVLHPAARPEPHRVHVQVRGAEPEQLP